MDHEFPEEVWEAIEDFPMYAVSSYGRIMNVHTERLLRTRYHRNGHVMVNLSRNAVKHTFYVSRLVARAFFLNYQPGIMVLHKNGNLDDISVLNLTLGKGCRKSAQPEK